MSTRNAPDVQPYDPEELSGTLFRDETIDVNRLGFTIVSMAHRISWLEDQVEPPVAVRDGSDMEDVPDSAPEVDDAQTQPAEQESVPTETRRRRK